MRMRDWRLGTDRFLIGMARNLTSMFNSQKIGDWLTFHYLQGDDNQRSTLQIKGFLRQGGGFDLVVDRKAKLLKLVGHPGTIGEWPVTNAPDTMVWGIDALA